MCVGKHQQKENEYEKQKSHLLFLTLGSGLSESGLVGIASWAPDSLHFPFKPLKAMAAAAEAGRTGFWISGGDSALFSHQEQGGVEPMDR